MMNDEPLHLYKPIEITIRVRIIAGQSVDPAGLAQSVFNQTNSGIRNLDISQLISECELIAVKTGRREPYELARKGKVE